MNSKFILFLLLVLPLSNLHATDLLVQEFGPVGTYNTIGAAVTAAADGDRIIISDRPGGPAWIENITLTKSITLLPAVSGTRFSVVGDYTISPATAGKQIRIIGMDNGQGHILATADAPFGVRTKVEIAGCKIAGRVDFDFSYFDMTVASNEILGGNLSIRFGNVYGNDMLNYIIRINGDALAGNEVVNVMGNRARNIVWNSSSHFLRISNNYVNKNFSGGAGIQILNLKNSSSVIQQITSNSIELLGSNSGIQLQGISASNAEVIVFNNVIDRPTSSSSSYSGISLASSPGLNLDVSFNFSRNGMTLLSGIVNNGTNASSSLFSVGANGTISATLLDLGHPSIAYFDHDLTRNNPGCYGGSYSMTNYYPQTNNPRVIHVATPSVILQGNTFNLTGEGFDR